MNHITLRFRPITLTYSSSSVPSKRGRNLEERLRGSQGLLHDQIKVQDKLAVSYLKTKCLILTVEIPSIIFVCMCFVFFFW